MDVTIDDWIVKSAKVAGPRAVQVVVQSQATRQHATVRVDVDYLAQIGNAQGAFDNLRKSTGAQYG